MRGLWSRWVAYTGREIDSLPLALVRILVPLCILGDLLRVAQLGLVKLLFTPASEGGLSRIQDDAWVLDEWVGPATAGPLSYGVTLVCMALISLGVAVRPAIVVGVLAYAQLGHAYPPGDRAIDRILRMTLLILLFSDAHRRLSVSVAMGWTTVKEKIAAWPADLIRYVGALVYTAAGIAKLMQQPRWLAIDGRPVLYRIVTDPLAAHMDPTFWVDYPWIFRVGSIGTIVLELSGVLLLTRFGPWWAIPGAFMHLGIFLSMELGMFSIGMLALYPVFLTPWVLKAAERARAARGRSATTSAG
ncbi:MAG: HTTM domain-containing protein [Alphaproteobacteria bacterium]|nr:HTTM domain-containing protein [Alphaproteobacteria bacterium]